MGRFDLTSETLHDTFADCQTEAAASLSPASRHIHPVEPVK